MPDFRVALWAMARPSQFVTGLVAKGLAISARGGVLLVLPFFLQPGQYGRFSVSATIGLIAARIFGCGAEEWVPLLIRRSESRRAAIIFGVTSAYFLAVIVFISLAMLRIESFLIASAVLGMTLMVGAGLSGVVRTGPIRLLDISLNAPAAVFLVLVVGLRPSMASALLEAYTASYLLIYGAIIWACRSWFQPFETWQRPAARLTYFIRRSWRYVLSNLSILIGLRSGVLTAALLASPTVLDGIAYATILADLIWQFGQVMNARFYRDYVRSPERRLRWHADLVWAGVTSLLIALTFVALLGLYFWLVAGLALVGELAAAALLGMATVLFGLRRYFLWSSSKSEDTAAANRQLLTHAAAIAAALVLGALFQSPLTAMVCVGALLLMDTLIRAGVRGERIRPAGDS